MKEPDVIDQITAYVKKNILDGTYKSADKVSERNICEQFNVSRTVVRQAFYSLKNTGWLYVKGKSGTYVSPVNKEEVIDNYKARIALEPHILMMAYPNITAEDTGEMKRLLNRIRGDLSRYYADETMLHSIFVRKTNNRYIMLFFETMTESMQRLAALSSHNSGGRIPQSIEEWSYVIQYLEQGDPQNASLWLLRHLLNSFQNYLRNNP